MGVKRLFSTICTVSIGCLGVVLWCWCASKKVRSISDDQDALVNRDGFTIYLGSRRGVDHKSGSRIASIDRLATLIGTKRWSSSKSLSDVSFDSILSCPSYDRRQGCY